MNTNVTKEAFQFPTQDSHVLSLALCASVLHDSSAACLGAHTMWLAVRARRPALLEFRDCSDVFIGGVTFQNAPYWGLHPFNCTGIRIDQVRGIN